MQGSGQVCSAGYNTFLHATATELYWIVSGEVALFDVEGRPAGTAVAGNLLGAGDLFSPEDSSATWTWAALASDDEGHESVDDAAPLVGPFRARTAKSRIRTEMLELRSEDLFGVVKQQARTFSHPKIMITLIIS